MPIQQWDPEKIKRLKKAAAQRERVRIAKLKRTIRYLLVVVVLGAVLILYDVFTSSNEPGISLNFINQEGTISGWIKTGFVKSKNDSTVTLVIDEEMWNAISDDKKMGVVLLLKAYYMGKINRTKAVLTIKGNQSTTPLVELKLPPPIVQ
ncbi:MAG: hypothetical protein V1799_05740 [bacterium]